MLLINFPNLQQEQLEAIIEKENNLIILLKESVKFAQEIPTKKYKSTALQNLVILERINEE